MSECKEDLLAVVGATGSGKTKLAIELCQALNGEIVSVDSAQVFQRMDIGTAKPTPEEAAAAKHHLIDVIEPDVQWSAVKFAEAADLVIADIRRRGKQPILCGGAGLWYRALLSGVFNAPEIDEGLRSEIRRDIEARGSVVMHEELRKLDPATAEKLHPNDKQRIGRALEVVRQCGRPISTFQEEHRFAEKKYSVRAVAYRWPVEVARERLAVRAKQMFEAGWIDEVAHLVESGLKADSPGLRCIGYREIVLFLEGILNKEEMIEKTIVSTRRYAKRQRNWFRQEDVDWVDPSMDVTEIINLLRRAPEPTSVS